jgi:hypothetical protein
MDGNCDQITFSGCEQTSAKLFMEGNGGRFTPLVTATDQGASQATCDGAPVWSFAHNFKTYGLWKYADYWVVSTDTCTTNGGNNAYMRSAVNATNIDPATSIGWQCYNDNGDGTGEWVSGLEITCAGYS